MYLMEFTSGRTDTLKLEESEVAEMARTLMELYGEKWVKVYHQGKIYKSWFK